MLMDLVSFEYFCFICSCKFKILDKNLDRHVKSHLYLCLNLFDKILVLHCTYHSPHRYFTRSLEISIVQTHCKDISIVNEIVADCNGVRLLTRNEQNHRKYTHSLIRKRKRRTMKLCAKATKDKQTITFKFRLSLHCVT